MIRTVRPSLVLLLSLCIAPSSLYSTGPVDDDQPSHGSSASRSPSEEDEAPANEKHSPATHGGPPCIAIDHFFADEVWAKVGEQTCIKCHHGSGDAAASALVLQDPARKLGRTAEVLAENRAALARLAAVTEEGRSRLLMKVTGELEHGGGEVLSPDSAGYAILERFVSRVDGSEPSSGGDEPPLDDGDPKLCFADVEMLPPQRLLRRVTLSLAARLPSNEEREAVDEQGLEALDPILDRLMQDDAFYERLVEGFNDILLTLGYDGVPERVLSYDHFSKTRHWTQKHDLSDIACRQTYRSASSTATRTTTLIR